MQNIQYVTDESGIPVAVQIPIHDWKLIKAELKSYDGNSETAEILTDTELLAATLKNCLFAQPLRYA